MLLFLYQVLSVRPAFQQTVAVSNLLERRQCAASSSPFERMAIFAGYVDGGRQCAASSSPFETFEIFAGCVDGGLNDSENIN